MAADAIDTAIATAAAAPGPTVKVTTYSLNLSSGKPAVIGMPNDATDKDWLDLLGLIVSQVRPTHQRRAETIEPATSLLMPQRPQLLVP